MPASAEEKAVESFMVANEFVNNIEADVTTVPELRDGWMTVVQPWRNGWATECDESWF